METGLATCPVCRMRVLPAGDHLCPSCHAYDFAAGQVVSEAAAEKARARAQAPRESAPGLHPMAVVSCLLGLVSLLGGPYPSIAAGFLAAGAGWWASRDIRTSGGPVLGLWLARSGLVVGVGMAAAWILILLVGRHVSK
jgi:hypothetical protein